eukprot:5379026-Pyramimonas_sp.AAC.1
MRGTDSSAAIGRAASANGGGPDATRQRPPPRGNAPLLAKVLAGARTGHVTRRPRLGKRRRLQASHQLLIPPHLRLNMSMSPAPTKPPMQMRALMRKSLAGTARGSAVPKPTQRPGETQAARWK